MEVQVLFIRREAPVISCIAPNYLVFSRLHISVERQRDNLGLSDGDLGAFCIYS
jgi:hypothetical protein